MTDPRIILGTGSGRCGTQSLAALLSAQPETVSTHEGVTLPWGYSPLERDRALWAVMNYHARRKADVGLYWISHIEGALKYLSGSARVICLKRDRSETVDSYLRRAQKCGYNHWTTDRIERGWRVLPRWDAAYPKFDAPIEEALGLWWDECYAIADRLQEAFPDQFRIFQTEDLNSESGITDMLSFAGYSTEEQVVNSFHLNRGPAKRAQE